MHGVAPSLINLFKASFEAPICGFLLAAWPTHSDLMDQHRANFLLGETPTTEWLDIFEPLRLLAAKGRRRNLRVLVPLATPFLSVTTELVHVHDCVYQ